jgi:acyl-CoA thioesterase FadM
VALTISYSAPVPVQQPIHARCRVIRREGRRIELDTTVTVDATLAARGVGTFVTVSAERYDAT